MDFFTHYKNLAREVVQKISKTKDPGDLEPDVWMTSYSFQPIELQPEKWTATEPIPKGDRLRIDIQIPFVPNDRVKEILTLQPSQWSTGIPSSYTLRASYFDVHVEVALSNSKNAQRTIDDEVEKFSTTIGRYNADLKKENRNFKSLLERECSKKREALEQGRKAAETALASIQVPIITHREKKPLQVKVKPKVVKIRESAKKVKAPSPELAQENVVEFVDTLFRLGKQFEVAPKVYGQLEEEDLRHILLATLNTVFELNGKGEAFNRKGKTDLYFSLAVDHGQVFIGECKVWRGGSDFTSAIDQLFDYLDWRKSFASLVIFSKNKSITGVLSSAENELRGHSTFRSLDGARQSEGYLLSTHSHPRDTTKAIDLYSLFFDLSSD